MYPETKPVNHKVVVSYSVAALVVIGAVTTLLMVGCPKYNVYRQRKEGEAILAHAQSSREVAVAEAKAKSESAQWLSQAEITRAQGVAQANQIIGNSLKGNEAYLRYLWIQNLEHGAQGQVIYVPTEAGLPIMEAGRSVNKFQTTQPSNLQQK